MSQNILNDRAQQKFNELKTKMNLHIKGSIKDKVGDLTQEKLDKMLDYNHILTKEEIKITRKNPELDEAINKADEIQETFGFIDSLNLPPQLSLAIGLIISAHKTNDNQDIAKAVVALGEYINANS